MTNNYYVYAYLRSKDSITALAGTPYYIGKGVGNRAFVKHGGGSPPTKECIIFLKEELSEQDAFNLEIELISKYGRKDLNTGILNNRTNGGDGLKNPSVTTRKKLSEAKKNESAESKLKRSIAAKNRIRHPCSEETKQKISKANTGKKRSADCKIKMSVAASKKILSNETKEKIKVKLKDRPKPLTVCPVCGKMGGISAMTRWHFNKCKIKQENEN
jgi:hypothetical protein